MARKIKIRSPRKARGRCWHTIEAFPFIASGGVEHGFQVVEGECREVQGRDQFGDPIPADRVLNYSVNGAAHWMLVFKTKDLFHSPGIYRLRVVAEDANQNRTSARRVFKVDARTGAVGSAAAGARVDILIISCFSHSSEEDITEEAENFVAYGGLEDHNVNWEDPDGIKLTKQGGDAVEIVHHEGGTAGDGYWSAHFAPLDDDSYYDLTGKDDAHDPLDPVMDLKVDSDS